MNFLLLTFALLDVAAANTQEASEAPFVGSSARYDACIATLQSDPDTTRRQAERWLNDGGGDPARHCAALADLARGNGKLAGLRLTELAEKANPEDAGLIAKLYAQAAAAFSEGGDDDQASLAIARAFDYAPDSAELQSVAAQVYARAGRWGPTKLALDAKEKFLPLTSPEFFLRAKARKEIGDNEGAARDTWEALRLNPENIDALILRGELYQAGIAIDVAN